MYRVKSTRGLLATACLSVGVGSTCYLLYYFLYKRNEKTTLRYLANTRNTEIMNNCPILHNYTGMPIWGMSGNVQSLYSNLIRSGPEINIGARTLVKLKAQTFAIDWVADERLEETTPIVCVVTGTNGRSTNDYVRNIAKYCKEEGFRTAVLTWPGCGDSPMTSQHFYTTGTSKFVTIFLDEVRKQYPKATMFGVGYSLGGNMLVKHCGEQGKASPLTAAVSLSSAYDARVVARNLAAYPMYLYVISRKWLEFVKEHKHVFEPDLYDKMVATKDVLEINALIAPVLNYKDLLAYYDDQSAKPFLGNITVPSLLLSSKDDPIAYCEKDVANAVSVSQKNENLFIATTLHGGHMCWVQGGIFVPNRKTWMEKVTFEFFRAFLPPEESIQDV